MKTILRALAVATVALASSFGCSNEEGAASNDDDPVFNGVDKTLSCGSGQVGWDFTTGGSSLDSIQGSARSGIQIDVASYGLNCNAGLLGNTTSTIQAQCNGSTVCNFTPGSAYDPAKNCAKNFDVTWKCGADSVPYTIHVDGESAGKTVSLKCGPQLTVQSGTYGKNCGVPTGTHSAQLKAKCDGTRFCEYKVDGLGDPKVGCAKDYDATWSCGESSVTSSARVNGEASGKTLTLSCDPYYPIRVKTAAYGGNCGVSAASFTKPVADLFNACNGKQECTYGIDARKLGDPKVGCAKDFVATYTCADFPREYTVAATAEASGKQLKLSCVGADGQNPAPAAKYATGARACIPAQCAWNEKRDAGMNCVADPSKQLITSGVVYSAGMIDPRTNAEPLQAGSSNVVALKANRPYKLRVDTDLEGPAGVRPRMVPWFTKQFRNPKTGEVAEGFLCTLTPVELYKDTADKKRVKATADAAILPTACFDSRTNAWADAAKRRNANEQDFRNAFVEVTNKLHVSIDPEGAYGFVKTPGRTPTLPNPPGFFFDAARNYVDLIAYYQQRELTDIVSDVNARTLGPGSNTTSTFRNWDLAPSPSIDVGLTIARVPQGAYQRLNYFDAVKSESTFELSYYMSGDWPDNPFSPTSTQTRIPNTRARRLRATFQVYPYNDEGNAITLGAINLDEANPTGAVRSAVMEWPVALRDAIFGKWGATNSLDMKVCIDADGSNTRTSQVTTVRDGPTGYELNIINNNGCFRYTNALVFSRDYTKRVLLPEVSSSSTSSTSSTTSGDSKSASTEDSGHQKSCSDSGGTHKCTATTRGGNAASGDTGRSTYGATTTTQRTETATTVTAGPSGQGEVLGYQVIDVDDDDDKRTFDKTKTNVYDGTKQPIKISIAPNWDLLIQSLKPQVPPPGTVTKGRAGGRIGLGIGLESKAPVFGLGFATLSYAVAASISLEFNMNWVPASPYPCTNGSRTKCFAAIPTAMTQASARKACEARGGRLAEMLTDSDRTGILGVASAAQNYWTGGQLNYSFSDVTCARNPSSQACKNASTTKFAWLASNKEFGSLAGTGGNAVLNASSKIPPAENGLTTNVPIDSGVVLHGATRAATTQPQASAFAPICEYTGAAKTEYEEWTVGLAVGAAAGATLGFCTPSAEIGICLQGTLNFVDVSIEPQFGHRAWTLYDGSGRRFQRYGSTFVDTPFSLAIMSGQVAIVANFLFFSTSWTLSQYNGIKLLGRSLGRTDDTFMEAF
ncbi:MAG: hypothetical protein KF764_05635 [Labilithrix sp.]|nr:hypothetical protein [Labilithrix sp.]